MALSRDLQHTEIGLIPRDWQVRPIKSIAERIMVGIASAATHAYRPNGVVMFRNQNIKPGYLSDDDVLFIEEAFELSFKNKRLKGGDLLTARTGYPGTTAVVPDRYDGAQSFTTLITRPLGRFVNSDYLCFYINSAAGRKFFEQNQIGGGQKNVNAGSMRELPVVLPPKTEQQAIATALSDADAYIESLEQLITKKRQIKQGVMQDLLTGKRRLPGFEGEWKARSIGELARLMNGYAFKSQTYDAGGQYSVITIANVQDGWMDVSECSKVVALPTDLQSHQLLKIGDILVSLTGNVGRVCRVSQPECLLNQRVGKILAYDVDEDFLFWVLRNRSFLNAMMARAAGGAQPNLSKYDILEYEVNLPNNRDEQSAIASVLTDIQGELDLLALKLSKARHLKEAMMQQLLTGKIRLV